jgi:hypothetical protein
MSIGKLIRDGLPFANVVATGTATANITPGRTLEKITLKLGGTTFTKAMLTVLKVKANGKVIIDTTGTILDKLNAYRSTIAQDANYLDIFFADFSLLDEFDRMVSAFDTSNGILNFTIEATITGATAPTLAMKLVESGQQKSKSGDAAPWSPLLRKYLSYPFNLASGGKLPFQLPFGGQNGAIITRVHVSHSGNMTGATVKQDGLVIMENVKLENEFQLKQMGKTPQANIYTLDFVADGNVRKALDTRDARSLEWLFDFSAADSGTVIVEYLDTLGNL